MWISSELYDQSRLAGGLRHQTWYPIIPSTQNLNSERSWTHHSSLPEGCIPVGGSGRSDNFGIYIYANLPPQRARYIPHANPLIMVDGTEQEAYWSKWFVWQLDKSLSAMICRTEPTQTTTGNGIKCWHATVSHLRSAYHRHLIWVSHNRGQAFFFVLL